MSVNETDEVLDFEFERDDKERDLVVAAITNEYPQAIIRRDDTKKHITTVHVDGVTHKEFVAFAMSHGFALAFLNRCLSADSFSSMMDSLKPPERKEK